MSVPQLFTAKRWTVPLALWAWAALATGALGQTACNVRQGNCNTPTTVYQLQPDKVKKNGAFAWIFPSTAYPISLLLNSSLVDQTIYATLSGQAGDFDLVLAHPLGSSQYTLQSVMKYPKTSLSSATPEETLIAVLQGRAITLVQSADGASIMFSTSAGAFTVMKGAIGTYQGASPSPTYYSSYAFVADSYKEYGYAVALNPPVYANDFKVYVAENTGVKLTLIAEARAGIYKYQYTFNSATRIYSLARFESVDPKVQTSTTTKLLELLRTATYFSTSGGANSAYISIQNNLGHSAQFYAAQVAVSPQLGLSSAATAAAHSVQLQVYTPGLLEFVVRQNGLTVATYTVLFECVPGNVKAVSQVIFAGSVVDQNFHTQLMNAQSISYNGALHTATIVSKATGSSQSFAFAAMSTTNSAYKGFKLRSFNDGGVVKSLFDGGVSFPVEARVFQAKQDLLYVSFVLEKEFVFAFQFSSTYLTVSAVYPVSEGGFPKASSATPAVFNAQKKLLDIVASAKSINYSPLSSLFSISNTVGSSYQQLQFEQAAVAQPNLSDGCLALSLASPVFTDGYSLAVNSWAAQSKAVVVLAAPTHRVTYTFNLGPSAVAAGESSIVGSTKNVENLVYAPMSGSGLTLRQQEIQNIIDQANSIAVVYDAVHPGAFSRFVFKGFGGSLTAIMQPSAVANVVVNGGHPAVGTAAFYEILASTYMANGVYGQLFQPYTFAPSIRVRSYKYTEGLLEYTLPLVDDVVYRFYYRPSDGAITSPVSKTVYTRTSPSTQGVTADVQTKLMAIFDNAQTLVLGNDGTLQIVANYGASRITLKVSGSSSTQQQQLITGFPMMASSILTSTSTATMSPGIVPSSSCTLEQFSSGYLGFFCNYDRIKYTYKVYYDSGTRYITAVMTSSSSAAPIQALNQALQSSTYVAFSDKVATISAPSYTIQLTLKSVSSNFLFHTNIVNEPLSVSVQQGTAVLLDIRKRSLQAASSSTKVGLDLILAHVEGDPQLAALAKDHVVKLSLGLVGENLAEAVVEVASEQFKYNMELQNNSYLISKVTKVSGGPGSSSHSALASALDAFISTAEEIFVGAHGVHLAGKGVSALVFATVSSDQLTALPTTYKLNGQAAELFGPQVTPYAIYLGVHYDAEGVANVALYGKKAHSFGIKYQAWDGSVLDVQDFGESVSSNPSSVVQPGETAPEDKIVHMLQSLQEFKVDPSGQLQIAANGESITFGNAVGALTNGVSSLGFDAIARKVHVESIKVNGVDNSASQYAYSVEISPVYDGAISITVVNPEKSVYLVEYQYFDGSVESVTLWSANKAATPEDDVMKILQSAQQISFGGDGKILISSDWGQSVVIFA